MSRSIHNLLTGAGSNHHADCLATGVTGIALMHIEYARTGAGGWGIAQRWAREAARDPVTAHPDLCGLFRGAPALAFVLCVADQPAYSPAIHALDHYISSVAAVRLRRAHQRITDRRLPALREWDLISGLTGIGVYLLSRHSATDGDRPEVGERLAEVLSYLVRLTEPLRVDDEMVPGWWCGHGPGGQPSRRWPGGHGNLGLAHGVSGPLALLATAMRHGHTVDGQTEAIGRIGAWLDRYRVDTGHRAWWPGVITRDEWRERAVRQPGPGRPSWCYGTPGLARAQQLAALALNDRDRQRDAEQALAGCVVDSRQLALLSDASLCHGWAGVLHTVWRAAADADDGGVLTAQVPLLQAGLERHLCQHGLPAGSGLLDGLAGVRLAQHATTRSPSPATRWDACLLTTG